MADRCLYRQNESKIGVSPLGTEDLQSSSWVGSVAMLGNIEDGTIPIEMIL